jgi:type VI protein secretion system component Hcp
MKFVCVATTVVLLSVGLAAQGPGKGNTKPQSAITVTLDTLSCTTPVGREAFSVTSWSWGASNPADVTSGGGGGVGKVNFSDVSVTKAFDACSPLLLGAVATGKHFHDLTLTQSNSDGTATTLALTDVIVSSWQAAGSTASEGASESVSFAFSKVCLTDGASGTRFCFDLKANKTV